MPLIKPIQVALCFEYSSAQQVCAHRRIHRREWGLGQGNHAQFVTCHIVPRLTRFTVEVGDALCCASRQPQQSLSNGRVQPLKKWDRLDA